MFTFRTTNKAIIGYKDGLPRFSLENGKLYTDLDNSELEQLTKKLVSWLPKEAFVIKLFNKLRKKNAT